MADNCSDSERSAIPADNNIRVIQTNLQSKIESFHKKISEETYLETCNICENVKEKVLNYEDESHLSKTQNNYRRITIASELFFDICSLYEYVVDYEFSKIINNLIQWQKYKYLSTKITSKRKLELKVEKNFIKEAQSKLQKGLEENRTSEFISRQTETAEEFQPHKRSINIARLIEQRKQFPEEEQQIDADKNSPPTEFMRPNFSNVENFSNTIGNFTELRNDSIIDTSVQQFAISHDQREIMPSGSTTLPSAVPEIPIEPNSFRIHDDDDISQILKILEEDIVERVINETEEQESEIDMTPENLITQETSHNVNQLDHSEEWKLPELKFTEKPPKKRSRPMVDETITIHNYSDRALYLNKNIKIQRIQVFEGPPKILNAISANYLTKTPSFRSSPFQNFRSSKLSKLFERHLKVEKKPVEQRIFPERTMKLPKDIEISKVRAYEDIVEEIGVRTGMHSLPVQTDVLIDTTKEKIPLEDLAFPQKESLVGVPVSRIFSSAIQPPDLDMISNLPVLPAPRATQLQGTSLDSETHTSWFYCTKQNPPSSKYKEFNYVYKKLTDYWSLSEIQGMEKSITLKEFITFEKEGGIENFLTLLRIIEKLSIQRKLLLEYTNNDVLIRPFEIPFVSNKQLLIREKSLY